MKDLPGISVVVITLNEAANIGDCLDSLCSQDYPNDRFEIIIVDASSDRTAEIAGGYRNVRVMKSEKGFARQKNAGWRAARYDIVAFTDADCRVPKGWLQSIAVAFEDETVMAVGGDALPPAGSSWIETCIACVGHPGGGALGLRANVTEDELGIDFIAGCNSIFQKQVLCQMNGFDSAFERGGEDVDLSRRLRMAGVRLAHDPDVYLYHKPHAPFRHYVRWNRGVGVTRWNLKRPGFLRMVLDPRFPIWPAAGFLLLVWLLIVSPVWGLAAAGAGWVLWVAFLQVYSRPYRVFRQKRRELGVGVLSALFMVPFLVLVRQISMSAGEFSRWMEVCREEKAGPDGPAGKSDQSAGSISAGSSSGM